MKPLTKGQKEKLHVIEASIERAIDANDLVLAIDLLEEVKSMLTRSKQHMRLIQIKNRIYEAAIEIGEYSLALNGLLEVKKMVDADTRTYLEILILIAICYIRSDALQKAEPIIREVLVNDKVIRSKERRVEFKKTVIERLNEEGVLFSLKNISKNKLSIDEVQEEVGKIIQLSEDEVYATIGQSLPQNTLNILSRLDDYSKKQLPYVEQKLIDAPISPVDKKEAGKTVFASVKRVFYKSLCDPKSEIYQAWFNNGLKFVLEKKFIVGAVVSTLTGFGIGIKAIAASVVALVVKFGIEVFCDKHKPSGIMELR